MLVLWREHSRPRSPRVGVKAKLFLKHKCWGSCKVCIHTLATTSGVVLGAAETNIHNFSQGTGLEKRPRQRAPDTRDSPFSTLTESSGAEPEETQWGRGGAPGRPAMLCVAAPAPSGTLRRAVPEDGSRCPGARPFAHNPSRPARRPAASPRRPATGTQELTRPASPAQRPLSGRQALRGLHQSQRAGRTPGRARAPATNRMRRKARLGAHSQFPPLKAERKTPVGAKLWCSTAAPKGKGDRSGDGAGLLRGNGVTRAEVGRGWEDANERESKGGGA